MRRGRGGQAGSGVGPSGRKRDGERGASAARARARAGRAIGVQAGLQYRVGGGGRAHPLAAPRSRRRSLAARQPEHLRRYLNLSAFLNGSLKRARSRPPPTKGAARLLSGAPCSLARPRGYLWWSREVLRRVNGWGQGGVACVVDVGSAHAQPSDLLSHGLRMRSAVHASLVSSHLPAGQRRSRQTQADRAAPEGSPSRCSSLPAWQGLSSSRAWRVGHRLESADTGRSNQSCQVWPARAISTGRARRWHRKAAYRCSTTAPPLIMSRMWEGWSAHPLVISRKASFVYINGR